jgi:hypothetical protein
MKRVICALLIVGFLLVMGLGYCYYFLWDKTLPEIKVVTIEPVVIPAEGGLVKIKVQVDDDRAPLIKVWAVGHELDPNVQVLTPNSMWLRRGGMTTFTAKILPIARDGEKAFSGEVSEFKNCRVYASDLAGNEQIIKLVTVIQVGNKTTLSQSLIKGNFQPQITSILVLNSATNELEREYLHVANYSLGVFIPQLKAVDFKKNAGIAVTDLSSGKTLTIPAGGYQEIYAVELTADGKYLWAVGKETSSSAKSNLLFSLAEEPPGFTALKDIQYKELYAIPIPSADKLLCENGDKITDLVSKQTVVKAKGYYGLQEQFLDIKASCVSPNRTKAAFLFNYNTPPGPNWIEIWDLKQRKIIHGFSYRPPKTADSAYVQNISLSWDGKWAHIYSAYLETATGKLAGSDETYGWRSQTNSPPFKVILELDGKTRVLEDPELWAMVNGHGIQHDRTLILNAGYGTENCCTFSIYDIANLKKIRDFHLKLPYSEPGSPAFSPDGKQIYVSLRNTIINAPELF